MPVDSPTDVHIGGSGSPLVLLHGINASWRVWGPVLPLLEAHYRVHAITLPGHRGGAALPSGPVGISELADLVEPQLDALGLHRTPLVGNSLGGWLALELAQRGRASSVVAFSPAGAWRRPRDLARLVRLFRLGARVSRHRSFARLLARPRVRRVVLRSAFAHPERIPATDVAEMVADLQACTLLDGLLASITAPGPALAAFALAADCPVRIAWAARDRTLPFRNYGAALVARVPGAEVVTLPGVGHVPMYDDPELVAHTVVDFVDRRPSDSSSS